MKKILFIFITIFLFSLSPIIALDNWGTGKVGQNFTITQICSDATFVTISTIQFPDRTIKAINENMSSTGNGAFSYNQTLNNQYGRYDITGISNGCEKSFSGYYEITPSGGISGNSPLIFFIIVGVIFFGLIMWGIKIGNEWVSLIGCFGVLILGIYISTNGVGEFKNIITNTVSYVSIAIGLGVGFEALRKITYY
jgi:hypothetical protein